MSWLDNFKLKQLHISRKFMILRSFLGRCLYLVISK